MLHGVFRQAQRLSHGAHRLAFAVVKHERQTVRLGQVGQGRAHQGGFLSASGSLVRPRSIVRHCQILGQSGMVPPAPQVRERGVAGTPG